MSTDAADLLVGSVAKRTANHYKSGAKRWVDYCSLHARDGLVSWSPLANFFLGFLAFLAGAISGLGLSYGVVKKTVSAVRYYCILMSGVTPPAFQSDQTWAALRSIRKNGRKGKKLNRQPITAALLCKMADSMDCTTADNVLFMAAACLGVRCLLRGGEYLYKDEESVVLLRENVVFNDEGATLFLGDTKTDTDVSIRLFRDPEDSGICPVRRLQDAMEQAPCKDLKAPLLQLSNGKPLSYRWVMTKLKLCLEIIGFKGTAGTHSLRIGGATDLARLGLPESVIKALGRWTSSAYTLYTRTADADLKKAHVAQYHLARSLRKGSIDDMIGLPSSLAVQLDMETLDTAVNFFANRQ